MEQIKKKNLIEFLKFFENMGELYNLFTKDDLDQLLSFHDLGDKINIALLVLNYSDYREWFEKIKSKLSEDLLKDIDILEYESFNDLLDVMNVLGFDRQKSLEFLKELYAGNIEKIRELLNLINEF